MTAQEKWELLKYPKTAEDYVLSMTEAELMEFDEGRKLVEVMRQEKAGTSAGSETRTWECFRDESYYGLLAVRPVGENRWGHCFHVQTKEEANGLCGLLNESQKTDGALVLRLAELARRTHYYCEDWSNSCPKHPDCCADNGAGIDCNCGADEINAEVDAILAELALNVGLRG